jgi:hypothetical protein
MIMNGMSVSTGDEEASLKIAVTTLIKSWTKATAVNAM